MVAKLPDLQGAVDDFSEWRSESFLDALLHVVPGLIYLFNQTTMSNEYANRTVGEAMGYSAAEVQAMGADMMPNLCHPEDLPGVMAHLGHVATLEDGEVAEIEFRIRHKAGHWVWMLAHDTVFDRDEDGKVVRQIGNASDITRQKEAEKKLQSETRLAVAANEDLRAFIYAVSHELKAPSNTIEMVLNEVLAEHGGQLPRDARKLLELAQDSIQRAQDRIEDVLDLTRFLDRQAKMSNTALDDVLARVLIDLADHIDNHGGKVTVGPLPKLRACPEQMHTLFHHLIENALKFARDGVPPVIEIWDDTKADASEIVIAVRDNGIGIPEAARARVFEMFKRLHLPADYPGNGLGLAICRRIVHGHEGDITVVSAPGQGSEFRVRLKR